MDVLVLTSINVEIDVLDSRDRVVVFDILNIDQIRLLCDLARLLLNLTGCLFHCFSLIWLVCSFGTLSRRT